MDKKRPRKSSKPRAHPISYRPSKGRRPDIERAAARAGQSLNAFIDDCVTKHLSHISRGEVVLGTSLLAGIRDEMESKNPELAAKLDSKFMRLRAIFMKLAGKR